MKSLKDMTEEDFCEVQGTGKPWSIRQPPPPVGYWLLPGSGPDYSVKFSAVVKPCWLHRQMMQIVLGFGWEDI